MPTNYTGSPTAAQSPSPAPGPGVDPIVTIPLSGEGATAASVTQMVKVPADNIAWIQDPRSPTPASPGGLDATYAEPTRWTRNVRLQRRDFIDHRGFANMARITRWQEDWADVGFTTKTSGGPDANWFRRWLYSITAGSGTPQILTQPGTPFPPGPGTPSFNGGTLVLDTQAVPGPAACLMLVEATPSSGVLATDDTDLAFQTEGQIPSVSSGQEIAFGISPGVSGATGLFGSSSPVAIAVVMNTAHAHPQLYACAPGASPLALTDLGSGALTVVRWRFDYVGANAADDTVARVIVYGDGTPLANVAIDLTPSNPANETFWTPFFRTYSGGGRLSGRWGVSDFAAARYAGDIAY